MGRGRAPCCDKSKVKKGPWSPAEDLRLISFIQKNGHGNWRALPKQAGLLRCGKSCRLRWINYLRPDVKRGNFSPEEEEIIISLHRSIGNKWSKIASHLPGRTDNEIKNVWNTHLKKKLGTSSTDVANSNQLNESKDSLTSYSASPSSPSASSCISYGELNLDKGPGGDHEAGQESVARGRMNDQVQGKFPIVTLEQCKPTDHEPKEASTSPTHSSATNLQNLDFGNGVSPGPPEAKSSLFHRSGPSIQVQNHMTELAEENISEELIKIPLESDIDFWNIVDAFDDPTQFNESQPQERGELEDEVECKKWLRYLENELGLVEGTESDSGEATDQQAVMKTSENEMTFRPEIDPEVAYFSMWPSSPQNFGI